MRRRLLLRGLAVAVVVGVGQVVFEVVRWEPQLRWWALVASLGVVLLWLVLDVLGLARAEWPDPVDAYQPPDSADDTVHHRVVTGHLTSRDPGPALRDRLLALARHRDPALADPVLAELADPAVRRLSPADIDRYLTRIEDARD